MSQNNRIDYLLLSSFFNLFCCWFFFVDVVVGHNDHHKGSLFTGTLYLLFCSPAFSDVGLLGKLVYWLVRNLANFMATKYSS